MNLPARVRLLEAQRIELLAKQGRLAARLDALEGMVRDMAAVLLLAGILEELRLCPCGFLLSRDGACAGCARNGAGKVMERHFDEQEHRPG